MQFLCKTTIAKIFKMITIPLRSKLPLFKGNFWKYIFLVLTALSLNGCGVSNEKEALIQKFVLQNSPQFEEQAKLSISKHPKFSEIQGGDWKWEYKKIDDSNYQATYGFYGRPPWWKVGLGFAIAGVTGVLTGGFFFWDPYVAENVSISLVVNIQSGSVRKK